MMDSSLIMSSSLIDDSLQAEDRPKRSRNKSGKVSTEAKKKKLSDEQVKLLELNFGREIKLDCRRKELLAIELKLNPKQVAIWFQNRRARLKNRQIEEKYMKLKSENEEAVVEKCQLEKEVLKLKKKLSETEEKIKKLSNGIINRDQNDLKALENSNSSISNVNYKAETEEINALEEQECFNINYDFMWMGWGDEFFF